MRNDAIRKDIVLALFEAGKDGLTDSGLLLALNKEKKDSKKSLKKLLTNRKQHDKLFKLSLERATTKKNIDN
mgnify:CR=1 FL=1